MYHEIIMSGVGGQGIMVIGTLLAQAAFLEDRNVTYMPIYGVEKRGGHADCTVVISSEEIGSPIVGSPQSCIVMSQGSLQKYGPRMKSGGLLVLNSSIVERREIMRKDLEILPIPSRELAQGLGNERLANMVVIGAFVARTRVVNLDSLIAALSKAFDEKYHHLLPANAQAIRKGVEFVTGMAS
jgi:2-oxoglutarate ferredoxin oxidoreductase subunit gamma